MLDKFSHPFGTRTLDEHKICFISNVNDENEYVACKNAISRLILPAGYEAQICAVTNAKSMTDGYQKAMNAFDAKYKIYLHQDVFVINTNLINNLLEIFHSNATIGMIGLAGSASLPHEMPVWWQAPKQHLFGSCYHMLPHNKIIINRYGEVPSGQGDYISVAAIDGLFMATQYDLPWRTDLFHGWHFYDISQSREFINAGYKVVIPHMQKSWVIHNCGIKPIDASYYENMEIFKNNYSW